ncbi:MAG TPA: phosphatase PAP2 family protein [Ktedonobacteraceae bacterium]|nr:phosphatase PAP2 family protein [Ktedonobacteraceae bacterium]
MQIQEKFGNIQQRSAAFRWFLLASVLCVIFLVYVGIYATGVLNVSTLQIEQWLLWRPITRVDCLFYEWRYLGEIPSSGVLVLVLGGLCMLTGYRRRVLPYLILLFLLCVSVEAVGKMLINPPLPNTLRSGMTVLTCPQMYGQPASVRIEAAAGLWWQLPMPPRNQVSWARSVAAMSMDFAHMRVDGHENSFPGGHAMRWSFVGMLISWLLWSHIRPRLLRIPLTVVAFILAFAGGFMQFYIGVHTIADTISGYLFGFSAACCAIGLLTLNSPRRRASQQVVSSGGRQIYDVPTAKIEASDRIRR